MCVYACMVVCESIHLDMCIRFSLYVFSMFVTQCQWFNVHVVCDDVHVVNDDVHDVYDVHDVHDDVHVVVDDDVDELVKFSFFPIIFLLIFFSLLFLVRVFVCLPVWYTILVVLFFLLIFFFFFFFFCFFFFLIACYKLFRY